MRPLPRTEPSGHRFDLWSAVLCALMYEGIGKLVRRLGIGVSVVQRVKKSLTHNPRAA
jgi:hypothetical protein